MKKLKFTFSEDYPNMNAWESQTKDYKFVIEKSLKFMGFCLKIYKYDSWVGTMDNIPTIEEAKNSANMVNDIYNSPLFDRNKNA